MSPRWWSGLRRGFPFVADRQDRRSIAYVKLSDKRLHGDARPQLISPAGAGSNKLGRWDPPLAHQYHHHRRPTPPFGGLPPGRLCHRPPGSVQLASGLDAPSGVPVRSTGAKDHSTTVIASGRRASRPGSRAPRAGRPGRAPPGPSITPHGASYTLSLLISVPPPPGPAVLSGVRGSVTIGPMCPVMRVDQPCPDRSYRAILIVRDTAGREITRTESSEDGTYALVLPPGSYVMAPQPPSASRLPWASPQPFEVRPAAWAVIDIEFDSGIR